MDGACDSRGPARFAADGAEYPVVVEVTRARGVWPSRPARCGDLDGKAYIAENIELIGGPLSTSAFNRTGELHCADRQLFVGEFTAGGEFLLLETV
jgi:hypothetical protein